jgi:tetratricopeptide (TPR) repeat protein
MNDWTDAERRVEKARHLFDQRKWAEALREIRAATSINPYNSSWFFNMGQILDEMGRFEEALDAYRQADAVEPDDPQILKHLGIDLHRTGRVDLAIETFQKIEAIDSTFEASYCHRILAHSHRGEHDLAEQMFYTARLYKEHCPQCYYNIGCSLEARGLYDKAIYCWTRALDLEGPAGDAHVRIGHAFWKKGDFEEARRHLLTDLRHNPGRTQTMLDLGELLVEMGRLSEASEKFRRAIEFAPHQPGGYYHYARLLDRTDHHDEAVAAFETVLRLDPTFPVARLGLGKIECRRGDRITARRLLRAELQLRSDQPKLLLELANLLMDSGDTRAALGCLKWLVSVKPDLTSGWLNLAVVQFKRRLYEDGIASCLTALANEPGNTLAMYNLALANEHIGEYEIALNWVRQARRHDPVDMALQRLEFRLRFLLLRQATAKIVRRVMQR